MFQFFGFELLVDELIFLEFLSEPPRKTILFDSLPGMLLNVLIAPVTNFVSGKSGASKTTSDADAFKVHLIQTLKFIHQP